MGIITGILKKIGALILVLNIAVFGYIAWPEDYTAVGVSRSGLPVVARAFDEAVTHGAIYQLDRDNPTIQALIRLDIQVYTQMTHRIVTVSPGWKTYVITGDLAEEISNKTKSFAFTDPTNKIVIFLAVPQANPFIIVAHEFTHVLQVEDGIIMAIPRVIAEYEAEVTSRLVVGLLSDFSLPRNYPLHRASAAEKLQVRKYLAHIE